jgi:hypothetical protein
MSANRREFGLMGAAALAAAAIGPAAQAAARTRGATVAATRKFDPNAWHQRLKRIMQVNFNEKDVQFVDAEKWADYLASCHAQATFINVTSMVQFFPSDLPDYPKNRYLNGRDVFGECVKAAKKRGIRIMGRFSIERTHASVAEKHPDWFRRTQDGQFISGYPQDPTQLPTYYATCQFTGYYDKYVPSLIKEVIGRYDIDGIYSNGWPGTNAPICYCETCRKVGDPHSQAYKDAYLQRAKELWEMYDGIVASHDPNMIFSGNLGGGFKGGDIDLKALTQKAAWFIADNQGRGPVGTPSWDATQMVRLGVAIMGDRPVPISTGAYEISGGMRWRNGTGNPVEVRSRLFQTTAAGGTLYYHILGYDQAFNQDTRWQEPGREILAWQAANDKHFHNTRSIADVALVASQRSNHLYAPPPGTETTESIEAFYYLLNEQRVPFDLVLDDDITVEKLRRYKVLILPNMALMSDAQARQIEAYAAAGGSVLATFETGLYDETGKPRTDFALANLFGVRKTGDRHGFGSNGEGRRNNPGQPSVQRIETPSHPILASFKNTHWLGGGSWRIPIAAEGEPMLSHIEQYPTSPTEAVYPRGPAEKIPTMVARERGPSRVVYFAEDLDAGFWRSGANDLGDLLVNAINWLTRGERPMAVTGTGLIEAYGWETEPGYAVHVVNYTNPAFRGTTSRAVYPVGPQQVRLQLRDAKPIKAARLLRAGEPLAFRQTGNVVEFTFPNLVDYEVAAFEV